MISMRCDLCACHSTPERTLLFGGILRESDGTLSYLCRDCFDQVMPLSHAERRRRWKLEGIFPFSVFARDAWDPERRDFLRRKGISGVNVCSAGAEVLAQWKPADGAEPYESGCTRTAAALLESGKMKRSELHLRFDYDSRTGESRCTPPTGDRALCGHCETIEPVNAPYQRCGRCRCAFYCGPACQQADWPRHKSRCVEWRE